MPAESARRVHTLADIAAMFGATRQTFARRIHGDTLTLDDGNQLRIIRNGRRIYIPDAELARLLGETTLGRPDTSTGAAKGPAAGSARSAERTAAGARPNPQHTTNRTATEPGTHRAPVA